jgi:putative heme transporter
MPAEDLTLPSLDRRVLARRAAVPAAAAAALVAAALVLGGPLQTFADAIRRAFDADPAWVAGAAAFELLSFGGYILLLWLVGSRASKRLDLRASAEITLGGAAATRLLPTAGAGGAAMTLWSLRRSGMDNREAAGTLLTFLVIVYAVFLGALALSGAVLVVSGIGPLALTALPAALAAVGMLLALAAAWWMPTEGTGRLRTAGAVLGGAVRAAVAHVRSADPRLLGALAWWGFDMAVLYGMLNAFGHAPPFAVVVLAYFLGQVANTVPVPGAASGGLVGVLLAFGVEADLAIVSVLAYRALAIWIPAPIGLVALAKLRRTMARWEREDAPQADPVLVPAPEAVLRPRPYESRPAWRPVEVMVAA